MSQRGYGKWQKRFHDVDYAVLSKLIKCVHAAVYRCTDNWHPQYSHYGRRGISVYGPWLADLGLFIEHLLTLPGHDNLDLVLDRRENDGHYAPGNLRFVTHTESLANRRI